MSSKEALVCATCGTEMGTSDNPGRARRALAEHRTDRALAMGKTWIMSNVRRLNEHKPLLPTVRTLGHDRIVTRQEYEQDT